MIRGKKSVVPTPIAIPAKAKLHNRFDFEIVDSITGEVKQEAYAENIILNKYWSLIMTNQIANGAIHIGTGTGALDPTRTTLFTFLTSKSSTNGGWTANENERWVSYRQMATWIETENTNTDWTEVGIAQSTINATLTTHALIKDLNGNPVTLHKGLTDIINVYSTVYAYLPAPLQNGALKFIIPRGPMRLDGTLVGWMLGITYFPCGWSWVLKGDMNLQSGGGFYIGSEQVYTALIPGGTATTVTGNAATKTLTVTLARLPAATHNGSTGIKGFLVGKDSSGYTVSLVQAGDFMLTVPGPWYPYSSITAETVGTGDGTNLKFQTKFPFVLNDGSFVLKANGTIIPSSDYTVLYGTPNGDDLLPYFKMIDWSQSTSMFGVECIYYGYTDWGIAENPWYATYGITTVECSAQLWSSPNVDGPWVTVPNTVPVGQQHDRYWKITSLNSISSSRAMHSAALGLVRNINFVAGKAPASGAVITADYHCEVIAKTSDNVFDLTVAITLQEKTS